MGDDPFQLALFFVQHIMTLIVIVIAIRAAFNTVEIGHPMYALLYQEAIVLALFVAMKLLVLLVMAFVDDSENSLATGFYMAIDVAALQFHQVTCLSVACLRCENCLL